MFADLLLIRRPASVFAAPQSLVFAVGTSVVTTVARGAHTIAGVDPESMIPLAAAAALVGSAIVALSTADGAWRPQSRRDWAAASIVAAVNSAVLFAAALGVEKF